MCSVTSTISEDLLPKRPWLLPFVLRCPLLGRHPRITDLEGEDGWDRRPTTIQSWSFCVHGAPHSYVCSILFSRMTESLLLGYETFILIYFQINIAIPQKPSLLFRISTPSSMLSFVVCLSSECRENFVTIAAFQGSLFRC